MLIGNYIHVLVDNHLETKVNLNITVHFSLTEIDGLYILHRQEIPYYIRSHERPQRHLVMLIAALQAPQVVIFLYASDNQFTVHIQPNAVELRVHSQHPKVGLTETDALSARNSYANLTHLRLLINFQFSDKILTHVLLLKRLEQRHRTSTSVLEPLLDLIQSQVATERYTRQMEQLHRYTFRTKMYTVHQICILQSIIRMNLRFVRDSQRFQIHHLLQYEANIYLKQFVHQLAHEPHVIPLALVIVKIYEKHTDTWFIILFLQRHIPLEHLILSNIKHMLRTDATAVIE